MIGMMTAVMTMVGQRLGEGRPEIAERSTWNGVLACTVYMSVFAVLYLIFPGPVLRIFAMFSEEGDFERIEANTLVLMRFVAAYTVFDGLQLIFGAAIRGAGDTLFALLFHTISGWLVLVIPTYVLFQYFDGGIFSAWSVVTCWVMVLSLGYFLRFQQGKWKTMKVIEPTVIEVPVVEEAAASTEESATAVTAVE